LENVILDELNVENILSNESDNEEKNANVGQQAEDFYTLIIGLDYSGSHNGINTDTLLVAHVIPQLHIVKLLSVPRDLRVSNSRGDDAKINSIFASGFNHAAQTAKNQPKLQVLNGETALQYARFRKDNRGEAYHSNDFERGLRQQKVIQALVDKMTSWNNLSKALDNIDIISSNLKTDMQPSTMISILNEYHGKIGKDDLYSLPFPGYWSSPYVDIDQEKRDELLKQFTSLDYPEKQAG